jgi:leader peptidase (prepilin peptidase)/N-methyltransferase
MMNVFFFVFGLVVGSFLNVCIVRLPRGRSIVTPPSHCVRCRERIKWYDNIPLISFLILRGRCRSCGETISWRYPIVELANALFYVWILRAFGFGGEAFLVMPFALR